MAECIKRDVVMKEIMAAKWMDGYDGAMAMAIAASAPAADVAPVVRCKVCKHLVNATVNGNGFLICDISDMETAPDDFCSYGERRDDA